MKKFKVPKEIRKVHKYEILKRYSIEEILAHGDAVFFLDESITDKKIKLRRAHVINQIGYHCAVDGCEMTGHHFAVGYSASSDSIHLDLYAYDQDGELNAITIDHIKPKSKGGLDDIENFQPMCNIHNQLKKDNYEE